MQVFRTIEENLKYRKFRIYTSGKYEPNLPKFFIDENVPPFYQDVDNWAYSTAPPVVIIDMCFQEVDFSIPDIDDMETVINLIQTYCDKANMIEYKPVELKEFLEKCEIALEKIRFAHMLFKRHQRNTNPDSDVTPDRLLDFFQSYDEAKS